MISLFVKAYWKQLLIVAMLTGLAIWCRDAWVSHGNDRYDAGYAQAQKDQKDADERARLQREQEKAKDEQEAQRRIDVARNDAILAAQRAGGLQQQLDGIRKQLRQYASTVGAGTSAADTGILLANVFSKSLERNRQLADYADRAADAGRTCERQYDSLTKQVTVPR